MARSASRDLLNKGTDELTSLPMTPGQLVDNRLVPLSPDPGYIGMVNIKPPLPNQMQQSR